MGSCAGGSSISFRIGRKPDAVVPGDLRQIEVVAERLAVAAQQLPQGVQAPAMTPLTSSTGLILVAGLTSKTRSLMDLKTLAEWTIRPRLLAVPGVANISVFGRDSRSLQIQVRPDRLIRYRLGMNEILAPAQKATGVRGAGFIDTANQRVVLQSEGQSLTPEQLARTALLTHGAARVTLSSPTAISFLDELGYLTFSASGGALLFHLLSNINSMSAPASSSRPISASESGQPCSATRR